ncbi:MAG: globin domain-containing protein [Magnetospiraceae bacterium]
MRSHITLDFEKAAAAFYANLIAELPELAQKFHSIHTQKAMFISALRSIDTHADDQGHLRDYLEMLGRKHVGFGITEHHMTVGWRAFRAALETSAPQLSDTEKALYLNAYQELVQAMGFSIDVGEGHSGAGTALAAQ